MKRRDFLKSIAGTLAAPLGLSLISPLSLLAASKKPVITFPGPVYHGNLEQANAWFNETLRINGQPCICEVVDTTTSKNKEWRTCTLNYNPDCQSMNHWGKEGKW